MKELKMKKFLTVFTFLLFSIAVHAQVWNVAGGFNGWNNAGNQLYDDGTNGDLVAGDGIFSADITIATAGRDEWKVTAWASWATSFPGSGNSWFVTTTANQVVKFTFNTNALPDVWWQPNVNILNANDILPEPFVAAGSYQGWNNAGPEIMTDDGLNGDSLAGDGIYCRMNIIATPGTYFWKVVKSGTWDGWGTDGRGVNADNASFTTINPNDTVYLFFNKITGRIRVTNYPLPVELNSFAASVMNDFVVLNWTTATEKNSSAFEVEKKQADLNTWQKIGSVKAADLSNSPKNYSYSDKNITAGKYNYRLKMVDNDGSFNYSSIVNVDISAPVKFELAQNFPNPFNPSTTIRYQLPVNSRITLKVFDMLGKEVTTLVNEEKLAGSYEITLNADKLSSGVYYYQLKTDNFVQTKKFALVK
jgi:Secretion system C-terminal sorting domain